MPPIPLKECLPSVVPDTAPGIRSVPRQPRQALPAGLTMQLLREADADASTTGQVERQSAAAIVSIAGAKIRFLTIAHPLSLEREGDGYIRKGVRQEWE